MKRKIERRIRTKRKIFIGIIIVLVVLLIMLLTSTLFVQNKSKKTFNNFTIEIAEVNLTSSPTYEENVSEESQEIVKIRKSGRIEVIP